MMAMSSLLSRWGSGLLAWTGLRAEPSDVSASASTSARVAGPSSPSLSSRERGDGGGGGASVPRLDVARVRAVASPSSSPSSSPSFASPAAPISPSAPSSSPRSDSDASDADIGDVDAGSSSTSSAHSPSSSSSLSPRAPRVASPLLRGGATLSPPHAGAAVGEAAASRPTSLISRSTPMPLRPRPLAFSGGKKALLLRLEDAELEEMERSASAHVHEELVARLVHEGVGGAALQEAVDDVPVDVPLAEVDDEFYAVPEGVGGEVEGSVAELLASLDTLPPLPEAAEEEARDVLLWQRGNYLGSGSFGDAYLALNLDTGEHYVVKQIRLEGEHPESIPDVMALQHEISVLQTLAHTNIVRYICSTIEGDTLNIFQEFVPGGSIASVLTRFGAVPEKVVRKYAKQILTGLEYLHTQQIIHRAIMGANIYLDTNGVIKLSDFGALKRLESLLQVTSRAPSPTHASLEGLVNWMAPEVIKQEGYSRPCDIWSVGCTVIEMFTGRAPWSHVWRDHVSLVFHLAISNKHPPLPDTLSDAGKDFLRRCFERDPARRPNATRLLSHPFIADASPTHTPPARTRAPPLPQPWPRTPSTGTALSPGQNASATVVTKASEGGGAAT